MPSDTWVPQGPEPTLGGEVTLASQSDPVAGAVKVVLAHPRDANVLYVGTVNGGIWRTENATDPAGPTWTPLTDDQASLSIGALEFDPTDPNYQTLLVGIGRFSAFRRTQADASGYLPGFGGNLTGLLRSSDGGDTWTPIGQADLGGRNIAAMATRGQIILVAANQLAAGGGLYRSTDGGQTFSLISGAPGTGLPASAVNDLASDPGQPSRFYAGVQTAGIFRSDDSGTTWVNVTDPMFASLFSKMTQNIKISVHNSPGNNVVYIGVANNGVGAAGFFRSTDAGATWSSLGVPQTMESGIIFGLITETNNGSGVIHFALQADPLNPNIVYVGGDAQPSGDGNVLPDPVWPNSIGSVNYTGRLFRGDASQPTDSVWTPLTDNFARAPGQPGTAPHADSRDMTFDAEGNLIEGDDGGVFKRILSTSVDGTWSSLNGNLQVTEFHSVAWDHNTKTIIAGAQDVGVPEQATSDGTQWRTVVQCDGGKVAVDASQQGVSIRYSSIYLLQMSQRRFVNADNFVFRTETPGFIVAGTGKSITEVDPTLQFYSPLTLNTIDPTRLLIGSSNLYESLDRGDNLTRIGVLGAPVGGNTFGAPMAYGGRKGGVANPNVLYVGAGSSLFHRSAAQTPLTQLEAYPGGDVVDIALSPNDWAVAYVIDSARVYRTADAGETWIDITGNLPLTELQTVAVIPTTSGNEAILVGGIGGVYTTDVTAAGSWERVGQDLPNAVVMDLHYDEVDNVLLAGTLGRGAWTLSDASLNLQK